MCLHTTLSCNGLIARAGAGQANVFCSIRQQRWQQHHQHNLHHHHQQQEGDRCCCHWVYTRVCECLNHVIISFATTLPIPMRPGTEVTTTSTQTHTLTHRNRRRQMILQVGPTWQALKKIQKQPKLVACFDLSFVLSLYIFYAKQTTETETEQLRNQEGIAKVITSNS